MEAQTVKRIRGGAVAGLGKFQPYPFANNFRQFVLLRQLLPQKFQDDMRFAPGAAFSIALDGLFTSANFPFSFMKMTVAKDGKIGIRRD